MEANVTTTPRIPLDNIGILTAVLWSKRGTCARRKVGCYLTDRTHRAVSHGYNGAASGQPHCIDHPCPGAGLPSGTGLELCEAIHAETNALVNFHGDRDRIHTCYVTVSPCINCTKLLLGTSCQRIVFLDHYPQPEAEKLWTGAGREWFHYAPQKLWQFP